MSNTDWYCPYAEAEKKLRPKIERAVKAVIKAIGAANPEIISHFFYGAIGIDPKHLVVWFIFRGDKDKTEAEANGLTGKLANLTREQLSIHGYPEDAINKIMVAFASDEEIKREGGWTFFK